MRVRVTVGAPDRRDAAGRDVTRETRFVGRPAMAAPPS
jgi:hypothetical protein